MPLSHAALGPAGPRPPLVLLHGLFGSRGSLQTVANALARRSGSQVRPGPGTGGRGGRGGAPGLRAAVAFSGGDGALPGRC